MRRLRFWGAGTLLVLAPLLLSALGPRAARRTVDAALRLSPASLRSVLLAHRRDVDRGFEEALAEGRGRTRGDLVDRLRGETDRAPRLSRERAPFASVAHSFGRMAGLVWLLNDPFLENAEPALREVEGDYARYVERKLPLLILSFDGWRSPPLENDLSGYFAQRALSAERYRAALKTCYYPEGKRVSSETFDDRSNAFGVAQAALSHAASDTAKVWARVWGTMGGDLSAAPFGGPPAPEDPGPEGRRP
ncbi:MAG: hypothetical protein ACP5VN_04280 [Acidobacteriota bacterium]